MRFNASEAPVKMGTFSQYDHPHTLARYAQIADHLGLGGKTDQEKLENLIDAVEKLKARIGIKKTIADYGVSEKDFLATLDEMTEAAFDDQCTGANPRYPLMSELKQLYMNAYYGGTFRETEMPDEGQFAKTAASPAKKAAKKPAVSDTKPAKRGRKPKAESAAEPVVTAEPKKRGRKPKAEAEKPAPKKRGRAKKQ